MILQAVDLSFSYFKEKPIKKRAIDNINLSIQKGEFIGLIGHSGSGKSTLVQLLMGLLKPTHGKVMICGMENNTRNLRDIRKKVGLVFQYPEHQLFEETVQKDIAFGLQHEGLSQIEIIERIQSAIEIVGLQADVLQKSPFELSGGQKRRVAIAGVLVMKPELVILDEPAAGLDPVGRAQILGYIQKLHEESHTSVILVSHNIEDIARYTKRLVVMADGRFALEGKTEEILIQQYAQLNQLGFELPQILRLMRQIKGSCPSMDDRVISIEDAKKQIMLHRGGVKK